MKQRSDTSGVVAGIRLVSENADLLDTSELNLRQDQFDVAVPCSSIDREIGFFFRPVKDGIANPIRQHVKLNAGVTEVDTAIAGYRNTNCIFLSCRYLRGRVGSLEKVHVLMVRMWRRHEYAKQYNRQSEVGPRIDVTTQAVWPVSSLQKASAKERHCGIPWIDSLSD
jgi:hypothetical protein